MQARNEVGESAWSDLVTYMTKATVPGDPQAPALISAGPTDASQPAPGYTQHAFAVGMLYHYACVPVGSPSDSYVARAGLCHLAGWPKVEGAYKGRVPCL